MANLMSILAQLGQSQGGQFSPPPDYRTPGIGDRQPIPEDPPEIEVTGTQNQPQARPAQTTSQERKGMFGVKGTLRDILGTLGDAFLVQGGSKPIYQPHRQNERIADALVGFSDEGGLNKAAERLADIPGASALATDLFNKGETREINRVSKEDMAAARADARYKQYAGLMSQYAGAANSETYQKLKPILQALKERGGLGDEFEIPDQYDADILGAYGQAGMTEAQKELSEYRKENLQQRRSIAEMQEAGRNSRDNPPAAPRSQSVVELTKEIMGKPANKRTPEEQDYLDNQLGKNKGRTKRATSTTARPKIDLKKWSRVDSPPMAE